MADHMVGNRESSVSAKVDRGVVGNSGPDLLQASFKSTNSEQNKDKFSADANPFSVLHKNASGYQDPRGVQEGAKKVEGTKKANIDDTPKKSRKRKTKKKKRAKIQDMESTNVEIKSLYVELNSDIENEEKVVDEQEKQETPEYNDESGSQEEGECDDQQHLKDITNKLPEKSMDMDVGVEDTDSKRFLQYYREECQKYYIPISCYKDKDGWHISYDGTS